MIQMLAISLGINIIMFFPAYFFRTDKLTDISYAATFALLAIFGIITGGVSLPYVLLASMIIVWAARLGAYLLIRINKMGRDTRFDEMRSHFFKFARFWVLQGVTVWIVLIPSFMFFQNNKATINILSLIGVVVWAIGLIIETFSDLQKFKFINNSSNKGKWINTGLWKYSRHPNYFGEITLWFGVYMYVFSSLEGIQKLFGLFGPLYIAVLIIFVSGVPMLEKSADKRWGENPDYRDYKKKTSVLIPFPPKK